MFSRLAPLIRHSDFGLPSSLGVSSFVIAQPGYFVIRHFVRPGISSFVIALRHGHSEPSVFELQLSDLVVLQLGILGQRFPD